MLSNDLLLRRLKCRSEIFAFLKRGTSELFYPRLESCNVSLSDTCSFIQQIYIDIIINTVTTAVRYMPRQKPLVRKTDNIKGHVFQKKNAKSCLCRTRILVVRSNQSGCWPIFYSNALLILFLEYN